MWGGGQPLYPRPTLLQPHAQPDPPAGFPLSHSEMVTRGREGSLAGTETRPSWGPQELETCLDPWGLSPVLAEA